MTYNNIRGLAHIEPTAAFWGSYPDVFNSQSAVLTEREPRGTIDPRAVIQGLLQ